MLRTLTTALVCLAEFNAFGKAYAPGDIVPEADHATWPDGTLPARLENKFVKYDVVPASADGAPVSPEDSDPLTHPELLEGFSKKELADFVAEHFPDQAANINTDRVNKADLLMAVKALVVSAQS